ncbi:hypothetical protein [Amycolatopsis sp. WAC 01375]|uniref:hypothetical protein n=1 Tax=unclassified Amycolatopsis TaxID=2618356 RepID=UPI0026B0FE6F
MVTLEDLLEEIVGEIYDETDRDVLAVHDGHDGNRATGWRCTGERRIVDRMRSGELRRARPVGSVPGVPPRRKVFRCRKTSRI